MTKPRLRTLLWVLAAALPLAAVSWLVARGVADAPPDLDAIRALARARRFDEAEARMTRYLRAYPGDARARLLMAQFALDRADPRPDLALEHLRRVRPDSPRRAALAQFFMGKAYYQRSRYDLAESCWREALRLDPAVPEAGWALLDLLSLEGRVDDARRLGLRLHETEPDPRDRVRLLVELARLDIDKPAPGAQVGLFEPVVRRQPESLTFATALGLALVRDSKAERGLEVLRDALRRHPGSPEAWDAWLTGLDDAGRPGELAREFARLPKPLADDPRFARHEGRVAQAARDWPAAARAYGRAVARDPSDGVTLYRLSRVTRLAGVAAEVERVDRLLKTYQTGYQQMRGAVDEALSLKTLGVEPRPELYQRLAELRERMGRPDEARAWHRLVLRDRPDDALSLATLERLK